MLRVKALGIPMVHGTMLLALTPPPRPALDAAVDKLLGLGALAFRAHAGGARSASLHDDGTVVTKLGRLLLDLPSARGRAGRGPSAIQRPRPCHATPGTS